MGIAGVTGGAGNTQPFFSPNFQQLKVEIQTYLSDPSEYNWQAIVTIAQKLEENPNLTQNQMDTLNFLTDQLASFGELIQETKMFQAELSKLNVSSQQKEMLESELTKTEGQLHALQMSIQNTTSHL